MTEQISLKELMNYEKTFDCVQCGYCLPACPTYETMASEKHSPRGRIQLMKLAAEEKITLDDMEDSINKCLGCMACTTVCPTNVQYGSLLEGAKHAIESSKSKSGVQKKTEKLLFDTLIPSTKGMNALGNATWLYQATGLQKMAQKLKLTSIAPLHLGQFERVLPPMPTPKERKARVSFMQAQQEEKMKVAFFTGCIMDSLFFTINEQSMELLTRAGATVVVPESQTCCGALHAHAGRHEQAIVRAKQNIEMLENEEVVYIVNNAGGCGAQMVQYDKLFEEGSDWHRRALQFVEKVRDITQVLVELDGLDYTTSLQQTVTYQPSCHMSNVQRVVDEPKALMKQIPGLRLQEMQDPHFCCGSAGIYNIVQYDESMKILDRKMSDVKETESSAIVTTNPGCLLQMKLGAEREGTGQRGIHLVELLMEADPQPKKAKQESL
ncbi:(Fe-S)-binding protein [Shouchella shacheensis]|uniref:(Fe-S)-binding protein n=1 Tax=Shouchella shacheensis TaxID=1649580 RepID=UPI0007404BC0|nr:(Fe-S)-binding protein [Shouchella shacheensis]